MMATTSQHKSHEVLPRLSLAHNKQIFTPLVQVNQANKSLVVLDTKRCIVPAKDSNRGIPWALVLSLKRLFPC